MKQVLMMASVFVMAAGLWLGLMENVLKHEGYAGRSVMAACIAVQGLATLLFVLRDGGCVLRNFILAGAGAMLFLGGSAVFKIWGARHFEGFVLIVGLGLIFQSALTLAMLLPGRSHDAA